MFDQVIDANVNRVSEGLRVIEEYLRFVKQAKSLTDALALLRKQVNERFSQSAALLVSRDTSVDMRAKEEPQKRQDIVVLLTANFKRVQEGLRVLEEYGSDAQCNRWRYEMYEFEKQVLLLAMKVALKPGFYLISDDFSVLEKGLQWGVSAIQYRDKLASKQQVYERVSGFLDAYPDRQVPFVLNDYVDIVKLLNIDGVHTGQDDIPVSAQRKLLGDHCVIGRTTHDVEQGRQAQVDGADYVSVGPLWETPSKPNRDAIGFSYLEQATTLGIPVVAIGGIDEGNIDTVMGYAPHMVGVIRAYDAIPAWQERGLFSGK